MFFTFSQWRQKFVFVKEGCLLRSETSNIELGGGGDIEVECFVFLVVRKELHISKCLLQFCEKRGFISRSFATFEIKVYWKKVIQVL
jgi:hypothetical protein